MKKKKKIKENKNKNETETGKKRRQEKQVKVLRPKQSLLLLEAEIIKIDAQSICLKTSLEYNIFMMIIVRIIT